MLKQNLPTYAIVELLMRLADHDKSIGDYKNHSLNGEGVIVKTTGGTIYFPFELIIQQFENPELVSDTALLNTTNSFKPFR
jgi:hypothetical protein